MKSREKKARVEFYAAMFGLLWKEPEILNNFFDDQFHLPGFINEQNVGYWSPVIRNPSGTAGKAAVRSESDGVVWNCDL